MEAISKWLLHDDQKDWFEILFAIVLNIVFLGLATLILLAFDRLSLALLFAKGYGVLWLLLFGTVIMLNQIHRFFRINLYDHSDAFVISNLVMSCLLQIGWAAFAAQSVRSHVVGATMWIVFVLYSVTLLSCLIAFFGVSSFFRGHIYRLISLALALICFLVFSVWPTSGRLLFGWFFDLF